MSNQQQSNQIPGVPEGWEIEHANRIGEDGEHCINDNGEPLLLRYRTAGRVCIIRKIEKPAKYRPFANAEEFKPHRDRWVRRVLDELVFRCASYGGGALVVYGDLLPTFSEAFAEFVFDDDGTPFGVKIDT